MSVSTRAIVTGSIAQVKNRSGVSTPKVPGEPGKPYSIDTALVLGEHCLAEVRFLDGTTIPKAGDNVTYVVSVGVFRDDDSLTVEDVLEHRPAAKAAA